MDSNKSVILVHGAGAKPVAEKMFEYWRQALQLGLRRDAPKCLEKFSQTPMEMFYYADGLRHYHPDYDADLDIAQREQVLERLGKLKKARDFRRRHYEELPGKTPLPEFAMDVAASVGFGGLALKKTVPELGSYWANENDWASRARKDLADLVGEQLQAGKDVLLISHCMGSVLTYDVLWSLPQTSNLVSCWITLGSPLGSRAVCSRLLGAGAEVRDRYPKTLMQWHNIAAEDDYVCHDKSVANDFKGMLDNRLIADITDHTIYNLAVRYGRSNPHHSSGYLVHPKTIEFLAGWLASD